MALFKNKETGKKRKGENVIGKIIYGFLLFAPLMSILFTSLYTVFNKNAFESYYGDTINEKQLVNNELNFTYNVEYTFTSEITSQPSETLSTTTIYGEHFTNLNTNQEWTNATRMLIYKYETQFIIELRSDTSYITNFNLVSQIANFSFIYTGRNSDNYLEYIPYFYTLEYNKYSFLDNAFEYGMYKTEQSSIYNWSKTTGTYTVLQNVCNGIGITNTFVPMLMAYWLLISIIYFLFDIALILIWAVHDKIHALKDTI